MRVIAGELGGRRLVAPHGAATRPTSDRVREALFSILGDVAALRVLDVYAGTGALGIEALSRGAAFALFVESGRPAARALRENIAALALEARCAIVDKPAERAIEAIAQHGPFDLVLLDPPYAEVGAAATVLAKLFAARSIATHARSVLEHASRDDAPTVAGLTRSSTRTYGDTSLSFYVSDQDATGV